MASSIGDSSMFEGNDGRLHFIVTSSRLGRKTTVSENTKLKEKKYHSFLASGIFRYKNLINSMF